jgi:hypothetical protein
MLIVGYKKGKSGSVHTSQVGRTNSALNKQIDNDICHLLSIDLYSTILWANVISLKGQQLNFMRK